MPGWASAYVELHALTGGHSDTVNHLSFSPDGLYLASCSDDQSLIIWNVPEGRMLYRALFKSKVDRSIWHPLYPETVLVGCDNGYLYQLHEFSPAGGERTQIELGVRSTIHCLAYDGSIRCLAVGLGMDVYVTREQSGNRRDNTRQLPVPRDVGDRENRLQPVNVHFLKSGEQLLASYLAHGIICWDTRSQTTLWTQPASPTDQSTNVANGRGSSALSPLGDDIAVYNVVDGVDIYGIKSGGGIRRKPKRILKYPRVPRTKHAVQVTYIIDGRGIVCGTTTGDVCVWDTANGEVYQVLNHDKDEIVQAVSGVARGKYSYVATATVDKGQSTYIKVWRAKYGKSPI
ncbi:WD40-repeat-containing domain protein [Cerioporus squamosus]|nr:WD40-repeat-containing domain protein [Cerioporus squamosus]